MEKMLAAATGVDITPFFVNRTYLAGFMPNRLATGVAEPLSARILYLEDADGPFVIVTADLIGLMLPDVDILKSKVRGVPPEHIVFCSTHVHSGPDTLGLWGPSIGPIPYLTGRDQEYIDWMLNQVAEGIARVKLRKRPALIGFAENRENKSEWVINIREPGSQDHTMSVMRVDGEDGRPIACLTNFACHPEVLWDQNTKISPDYVHYLHKQVESQTGAISLFANGALGAMVTMNLPDPTPLAQRKSYYRRMGKALGDIAAKTWAQAEPASGHRLQHRYRRDWVPFENAQLNFVSHLGLYDRSLQRGRVETCLHTWRLGPAAFATLPGEATPAIGLAAKELLPGEIKFLFGLADDELGYLLTRAQASDAKYHYERSVSIGPKGAEALLQILQKMVAEL